MAINNLEFASIFQTTLDRQIAAEATTGWMEMNSSQVKYEGGNEIKLPRLTMNGLGDYDRDEGFTRGSVNLTYQTLTMKRDRGRTFQLDAADVDETNFAAAAGNVLGEFQRTMVIPEIDAYRYSTIAKRAEEAGNVTEYTPTEADVLKRLMEDIEKVRDAAGAGEEIYISMAVPVHTVLNLSAQAQKLIDIGSFDAGGISTRIKTIDGNPLISVSSALMKDGYIFKDGRTEGQLDGGFEPAAEAKGINWIICLKSAPIAVSKTDVSRIFDPMTNQNANAWKIDYRKYHDIWVPDNAVKGVWVNMKPKG